MADDKVKIEIPLLQNTLLRVLSDFERDIIEALKIPDEYLQDEALFQSRSNAIIQIESFSEGLITWKKTKTKSVAGKLKTPASSNTSADEAKQKTFAQPIDVFGTGELSPLGNPYPPAT